MKKQYINKIGLLYIKDKKLLVVYKPSINSYITPGGKIESKESNIQCVNREIFEELGCKVNDLVYFQTFTGITHDSNFIALKCYFGKLTGKLTLKNEITDYVWITSDSNLPFAAVLRDQIIPKLTKEELL